MSVLLLSLATFLLASSATDCGSANSCKACVYMGCGWQEQSCMARDMTQSGIPRAGNYAQCAQLECAKVGLWDCKGCVAQEEGCAMDFEGKCVSSGAPGAFAHVSEDCNLFETERAVGQAGPPPMSSKINNFRP